MYGLYVLCLRFFVFLNNNNNKLTAIITVFEVWTFKKIENITQHCHSELPGVIAYLLRYSPLTFH